MNLASLGMLLRVFVSSRCALVTLCCLLVVTCQVARANLGGFEAGDGYQGPGVGFTLATTLVDQYNAGQYGLNNMGPGGGYASIVPSTGLWRELQPATNGYALASTDGNHTPGGVWSLDLRGGNFNTFRPGSNTVDGEWRYRLDSRDLGGINPASINNDKVVMTSFYYCGGVAFQGDDPGVFRMRFLDQTGNAGLAFGLDESSALAYRDALGTHVTSTFVGPGNSYPWTYVRVVMDFANDTFDIGITPNILSGQMVNDFSPPAVWLVQNATMVGGGMANLSGFEFWVDSEVGIPNTTGVNNSNKQLLDDFQFHVFTIPEPTGMVLLWMALGSCVMLRPRFRMPRD